LLHHYLLKARLQKEGEHDVVQKGNNYNMVVRRYNTITGRAGVLARKAKYIYLFLLLFCTAITLGG